jgi:hypothetical protein
MQRLTPRTENFGLRFALAIIDFLATGYLLLTTPCRAGRIYRTNGKSKDDSSAFASSSVFAEVTIVMSIPRTRSIWS